MPSERGLIAVVNAGSATLKFSILRGDQAACQGLIDRLTDSQAEAPHARVRDARGTDLFDGPIPARDHGQALEWLFDWLDANQPMLRPRAIGHRVVHGGDSLVAPARVTPELIDRLEALVPLAPLHQPHNLAPIRFLAGRFPELPQVVCFDTAFHATQSRVERLYGLPRSCFDQGIKRYGFHGLSYEFIATRLPEVDGRAASGRTVVCHLGNGASLCAMRAGRSVATTMGFTALEAWPWARGAGPSIRASCCTSWTTGR